MKLFKISAKVMQIKLVSKLFEIANSWGHVQVKIRKFDFLWYSKQLSLSLQNIPLFVKDSNKIVKGDQKTI